MDESVAEQLQDIKQSSRVGQHLASCALRRYHHAFQYSSFPQLSFLDDGCPVEYVFHRLMRTQKVKAIDGSSLPREARPVRNGL